MARPGGRKDGITNCQIPNLVERKAEFKTGNGYRVRVQQGSVYAVYSYGFHFPVAAFINGEWYVNETATARDHFTASGLVRRHRGSGRPVSNSELKNLIAEARASTRYIRARATPTDSKPWTK